MQALEGRSYGPYPLRVCRDKVVEFVGVTADLADRWIDAAPPGYLAACLFTVAPHLLESPEVAGKGVIHGEQRFSWDGPIKIEDTVSVTGEVTRVRERGGVSFLTFDLTVAGSNGSSVGGGSSLFVVSGEAPAAGGSHEETEPAADAVAINDPLPTMGWTAPLRRSASRADLIRYAAATRDWNPIHWDHQSAVEAGLPGVVAHGLLQTAWLLSAAASQRDGDWPVSDAAFRFRSPLRPAAQAHATAAIDGDLVNARLIEGDIELVSSRIGLR